MSLLSLRVTYFDIEIIHEGKSLYPPRYINRTNGNGEEKNLGSSSSQFYYYRSNSPDHDPRLTDEQPLFCAPNTHFKFNINRWIDKN